MGQGVFLYLIIWNKAIAYQKGLHQRLDLGLCAVHTVKAVPMVSSFPCATYTKNAETDTRIGAHVQMSEKTTELVRAEYEAHGSVGTR